MRGKKANGTILLNLYSERKIAATAFILNGETQSGLKQVGVRSEFFI